MLPFDTILQTTNYRLRIPDKSDIDFVYDATRFPGFNDGMQWDPPKDKKELIAPLENSINSWQAGTGYGFTIENTASNPKRLGRISIRKTDMQDVWNIGYWTHPEFQGQGIMSEVVGCILEFGFVQLNAAEIRSCYALWNKASEKVLLKNGFKFVRHIEKGLWKNNAWVSETEVGITRKEYEERKLK